MSRTRTILLLKLHTIEIMKVLHTRFLYCRQPTVNTSNQPYITYGAGVHIRCSEFLPKPITRIPASFEKNIHHLNVMLSIRCHLFPYCSNHPCRQKIIKCWYILFVISIFLSRVYHVINYLPDQHYQMKIYNSATAGNKYTQLRMKSFMLNNT